MKVRVIQHPSGEKWIVEEFKPVLFFFGYWEYSDYFYGDDAKQKAIEYAHRLANPEIIEVSSK